LGQHLEVCSSGEAVLERPIQAKEGLLKGADRRKRELTRENELVTKAEKMMSEMNHKGI